MSSYMNQLKKEVTDQIRAVQLYPVKVESKTHGFRMTKENARLLAMQLLIAAETSEQISISGSLNQKDDNGYRVIVARYK